ncbi:hypothetical protein ACIBEJ_00265 [Nonomuraea sp. NPDC050790]|uniref:hypothetical protein n=1 Tax=Nonomuraea sp. NPDC050790 TaxID=3364371 RepID=UPI003796AAC2
MEPNRREVRACDACQKLIFFALTENGSWQALDAKPDPQRGTIAAYRQGVRRWLCRSLLADDADQRPAHPLERRFTPHAQTCAGRKPSATQPTIPGFAVEPSAPPGSSQPGSGNVIPFRRRRG